MKSWVFLIFMCYTFTRISTQDCSIATTDFTCSNDNVAICLDKVTTLGAVIINCVDNGLTCDTQTPTNGCQSPNGGAIVVAVGGGTGTSSTTRGTCADNRLKLSRSNCRSYYKCVNGKINSYNCPPNTCYNPDRAACMKGTCVGDVCTRS